jgi:hypothetical protein
MDSEVSETGSRRNCGENKLFFSCANLHAKREKRKATIGFMSVHPRARAHVSAMAGPIFVKFLIGDI